MQTPAAKRRLNFGNTPAARSAKRARRADVVVVRGNKAEMKSSTTTVAYSAATADTFAISNIAAGSGRGFRIGNKIKVWAIEYFLGSSDSANIRVDILNSSSGTASPTVSHTYYTEVNRDDYQLIETHTLHNGTLINSNGCYQVIKLPVGINCKYNGTLSTNCITNQLLAHITTPSSATVSGYFRIWYTDV